MLYSGVIIEKVFCIFRDDKASRVDQEINNQRLGQPFWSLLHVDDGVNDLIYTGDDWNVARPPRGHDQKYLVTKVTKNCIS